MSQDVELTLHDGTRLGYHWEMDTTRLDCPQSWVGWAILAPGPAGSGSAGKSGRLDWTLQRVVLDEDHLHLDLGDGSALDAQIPLQQALGAAYWPVFDPGGTGHFTSTAGVGFDFGISGEDDTWDTWAFTAGDGTRGSFSLGEDLAGNGTLTRNGAVVGALRWPADGFGTLDLVDAGSVEVAPSAAALDFQVDRWVANMAAMGPMPMY